jgi:hypothetical protein
MADIISSLPMICAPPAKPFAGAGDPAFSEECHPDQATTLTRINSHPVCAGRCRSEGSGNARRACKPDFVQGFHPWMTIPLPTVSPRRSSCQPGPLGRWHPCGRYPCGPAPARGPYLALLRVGLAVPSLLPSPRWALTPPFHHHPAKPKANLLKRRGSFFSVALSLGLPPPGVTRHPCQRESGLSSEVAPRGHPALRAGVS